MKFCQKCGKEIMEEAVICPNCGCSTGLQTPNTNTSTDSGSTGWAVLGFFIPIVGLILHLSWKQTRPNDAKKAGKGALIGFIFSIIFSIVFIIIYSVFISSIIGSYESIWSYVY